MRHFTHHQHQTPEALGHFTNVVHEFHVGEERAGADELLAEGPWSDVKGDLHKKNEAFDDTQQSALASRCFGRHREPGPQWG